MNCLRWSNKGNFLASGAGDNLVMIWQQVRVGEAENWKRVHALHKHTADVFSLNWSPNDAMLASCGVDNTIIIWDVQKNFETVTILREDVGTVKGVTWDPIGKYLATQSDEQLRVWRTADWKTQYHVSDFFEKVCLAYYELSLSVTVSFMAVWSRKTSRQQFQISDSFIEASSDGSLTR